MPSGLRGIGKHLIHQRALSHSVRPMVKVTSANRWQLATVAAAVIAAGLPTAPVAVASPMYPAAPACDGYKLPSFMGITEGADNDIHLTIGWAPDGKSGRANMGGYGGPDPSFGNVTGGLNGGHAEIRVDWDQGPFHGTYSRFVGDVRDDLTLDGVALNTYQPGTMAWHMEGTAECVAAKPATSPSSDLKTARVVSDVDVYDAKNEPDGAGVFVGILHSGNTVQLLGPCQKKAWCNVSGDAVPTGSGWVWGALDF